MSPSCRAASRVLLLALSPAWLGACTMVGAREQAPARPVPGPGGRALTSAEAARIRAAVVETALAAIGTPYEWGGTTANGFDCSGLIQFAYAKFGIQLPRVSTEQVRQGYPVELRPELLRPGDVLGFSLDDPNKTSHVGLYVGDDEFIHSSSSGVRTSNILNPYWQEHLIAARRIVR